MNASELILNADGSIYHLALHPEQVAPIIITVGDPDRVAKISSRFDRVEHRVHKREFVTHTGWLGSQRISVISTGIGTDNVDIVMNELDALVNIDLRRSQPVDKPSSLTFIRIGTTGGLQAELPAESWVASSGAFGLDGLLQFYRAPDMQQHPAVLALRQHCAGRWHFPVGPYFAEGDAALLRAFSADFYQGLTLTNSGFYGPQGRRLRADVAMGDYLDMYVDFDFQGNRVLNLEMETSALYGLGRLLGHRAVSLSVILANRALGTFSQNPGRAVERLIEHTLQKISEGVLK